MLMYTDDFSDPSSMFGEPVTPAHFYVGTTDFSAILEDMVRGNIPVGTQKMFPVIWKSDGTEQSGISSSVPFEQPYRTVQGENIWKDIM